VQFHVLTRATPHVHHRRCDVQQFLDDDLQRTGLHLLPGLLVGGHQQEGLCDKGVGRFESGDQDHEAGFYIFGQSDRVTLMMGGEKFRRYVGGGVFSPTQAICRSSKMPQNHP